MLPDSPHIGTLAEKSLHAALKNWYGRPGDQFEVKMDGYVVDIIRDKLLIEIQTRNFGAMKRKLSRLLVHHPIHLVHPIPQTKWIVRQTASGESISRRKSPRRGQAIDIFSELVRIPHLISHPNLTIEVVLTREEEVWQNDGQGSWRRKRWSIYDHRLLEVVNQVIFASTADLCALLPADLAQPFTNQELAAALGSRAPLAQKMTYTLRRLSALTVVGKRGNALLHEITDRAGTLP